jgi:beta-lactamase regulating signal transducer with metallopeptidase domain
MNSIELAGIDWFGRGWLLILAFTAAVLVVAALRKPCRRLFGAERAFQLWLLPPLAMLASQLPHAAAAQVMVLSPAVSTITLVATLPMHAAGSSAIDWRAWAGLLWLAGTLITLGLATLAQTRYRARLRSATPVTGVRLRWPVLRAAATDVGPAMVGAWRSRIVLPADFEHRYDAAEQVLILAHEAMHARRRDGWWCLLAQAVTAMFWFHPLAWWALSALRHDQELACDAAVLREHGEYRRSYAQAMLKTQSAVFALPVGCPWSPRHPITERIAMLKQSQPKAFRRHTGGVLVALLTTAVVSAVYAATPAAMAKNHADGISGRYTLDVDVAMGGRTTSAHFSRCVKPNEYADLSGSDTGKLSWQGRFAVLPVAKGELEIRTQIDTRFERAKGNVRTLSGKPIVRTMPGQKATIVFGQAVDGMHPENEKLQDNTIRIGVTAAMGCSAASLAQESSPSTWTASPVMHLT